jgi:phosphatidylserine decarboxylase
MIRKYQIELSEFAVPTSGFQNYRDFHARQFKENARKIDPLASLIFPSDGIVLDSGTVNQGILTQVKGIQYSFDELLNVSGFPVDPAEFEGGSFLNLYLPIESYHRWHSPMDGFLVQSKYIHGTFLSLDMRAMHRTKKIYTRNERLIQRIQNEKQAMLLVAVGGIAATNVFSFYPIADAQKIALCRGQEMGGFYLGSSMVLISQKTIPLTSFTPGQKVRLGESLAL